MLGALVQVLDVSLIFNMGTPNETVALNKVNLEVRPGEVVILQGGNGSGKSSLLKVIAGIYRANRGKILIDEKDVTNRRDYLRARYISYVHQDPLLGTAPNLTLFENLSLTSPNPWWLPLPYSLSIGKRREEALNSTGLSLDQRLPVKLMNFSGGQRQAIAIGMAFSRHTRLVLLDEFTASLDYKTSKRVAEQTLKRAAETKATIMIIMHDKNLANQLGCKTYQMDKGEIV